MTMTRAVHGDAMLEFLEFFYPIHYRVGMALEDALRLGKLTRKQVTILWLIRSEGERGRRIKRKRIEQLLSSWFEISSSAITKALRAMARPPMNLIDLTEDPHSGREKQVSLTPKGERFVHTMVETGRQFIGDVARHLSPEELRHGIDFLRRVSDIIQERVPANGAARR
jgi:DNA-binding MarR family transcriptional regulator